MPKTNKIVKKSTPLFDYYQALCDAGRIVADHEQLRVLHALQPIYDELIAAQQKSRSLLSKLRKTKLTKGAYLFGGVGIGKTFLMDCFYECLPFKEKKRYHFHAFMRMIHAALTKHQHIKNPLATIAKEMAIHCRVLCLDEFIVTDIVDAMLLARLLQALFTEGVCLVATSNTAPDDLYLGGLQRVSFLPAIHLLKQHTNTVCVATENDYREQIAAKKNASHSMSNHSQQEKMEQMFLHVVQNEFVNQSPIYINHRWIEIRKSISTAVWFDFDVICHRPRSQHDYLEIVKHYQTIFVSDIPKISPHDKNTLALFIRFIDVIYDAKINFIFSSNVPLQRLFDCTGYPAEYARTCSRLKEMHAVSL